MTDATDQSLATTAPRQFAVKAKPGQRAEVLLEGEDIADKVAAIQIEYNAAQPFAEVVLVLNARHTITPEFDGLAHVQIGEPADPGPAAASFLSAIDPEALEQAAMRRRDLEPGPHGLTKAMIAQLIDWSNGA